MSDPGCRFCMRRKACVATCLRTTHPKLARADEWDYKTNDAAGVTPDNKLSGSKTEVSWLCKRHGPYLMTIYDRTRTGKRCRPCTDETAREKRRITLQAKGKARHLLAVQGRERLNAERDEAEGEPSG